MDTNPTQRNYGIDLLRLVAALYVIILHTLNQGGLFSATDPYSYQNYTCRLLLIFSFCSVNIFGIISGYVGYNFCERKFSISGYLSLWMDVVFYGVALTLIAMYMLPDIVTSSTLLTMISPVTNDLYWYFTAYTMVYFLSPFLNRMIHYSSEKELNYLFILICFIIVPIEYAYGIFMTFNGFTAIWLILLYLIGAIMKKNRIGSRIHPIMAAFSIILINTGLLYLNMKCPEITILNLHLNFDIAYNQTYVSPFFVATSILHVALFSKIRTNTFMRKIIAFAAPASFAVYIVNVQECVWLYYMKDRFVSLSASSPAGIIIRTLGFSFLFVLTVVFADFCKRKLFHFLKIDIGLRKLAKVCQKSNIC